MRRVSRKEDSSESDVVLVSKVLDDRFANPAYGLLLLLGLAMVWESGIPFSTFWIAASLVLYVVIVVIATTMYSPTLRRQVALAEAGQVGSPEYRAVARRGGMVGVLLSVIV